MSVKSSGGVFEILRALAASTTPLGASELGSQLGLPATTAGRAAATLEAAGFARRAQTGAAKFELGSAGQLLAYAFMSQFPIRKAALPYLQQLAADSGFSSSLFLRLGRYALRIAFIAGSNSIIHVHSLGEARALTEGAAGKAMLAYLPVSGEIHGPEEGVGNRVAARRTSALQDVRTKGWALEASTLEQGGYDLAFPVLDARGHSVAAVVIEGLPIGFRAADERIALWAEVLGHLQGMLNVEPALLRSPYDHIDARQIELGSMSVPASRSP